MRGRRNSLWLRLAQAFALASLLSACAAQSSGGGAFGSLISGTRGRAGAVGWEAYDRYEDARLSTYVQGVASKIAAEASLEGEGVEVILVDAPAANATAGEGRQIAVTTGLLALLLDEAELAWVLAHEIGHLELRHPQQLAKLKAPKNLTGAKAFAALRRQAERDADARAVELMRAAGYHIGSARRVTERLAGGDESAPFAYLASHPTSKQRLRALPARGSGFKGLDAYMAAIDGTRFTFPGRLSVPFGDDLLIAPSLKLALRKPAGFKLADTGAALEFTSPDGLVRMRLRAMSSSDDSLEETLRDPLHKSFAATVGAGSLRGVKRYKSFGGRDAATGRAEWTVGGVDGEARLSIIQGDQRRFVIVALYPKTHRNRAEDAIRTLERGITPIDALEKAVLDRLVIRVVRARAGERYETLIERVEAAPIGDGYFRYLNGLGKSERLKRGQKVKVVTLR